MAGTTINPYRFGGQVGYRRDGTNRNYVRARNLDTQRGRWINQDPIGFKGIDWNTYRYANNSPSIMIDPLGLKCFQGASCGPNIKGTLITTINDVVATFNKWNFGRKLQHCNAFVVNRDVLNAWDMPELHKYNQWISSPAYTSCNCSIDATENGKTIGGGGICDQSVEVDGRCYYSGSVNYLTLGVMWSACSSINRLLFTEITLESYIEAYCLYSSKPNCDSAKAWAKAGYRGWPNVPTPNVPSGGDRWICPTGCPQPAIYSRFSVNWDPDKPIFSETLQHPIPVPCKHPTYNLPF